MKLRKITSVLLAAVMMVSLSCCGSEPDKNESESASAATEKIEYKFSSVSLGDTYSAAITTDGSLYTWGKNNTAQLGTGTRGEFVHPTPTLIEITE